MLKHVAGRNYVKPLSVYTTLFSLYSSSPSSSAGKGETDKNPPLFLFPPSPKAKNGEGRAAADLGERFFFLFGIREEKEEEEAPSSSCMAIYCALLRPLFPPRPSKCTKRTGGRVRDALHLFCFVIKKSNFGENLVQVPLVAATPAKANFREGRVLLRLIGGFLFNV